MIQAKIQILMAEFSSNWKHVDKLLFKIDLEKIIKLEKETLPTHCSIFIIFCCCCWENHEGFYFNFFFLCRSKLLIIVLPFVSIKGQDCPRSFGKLRRNWQMVCEYKQFWKTSFNENLLSSNCSQLQLISCEK